MPDSPKERRRFPRGACSVPVNLHPAGQSYATSCETTDLSLCGCYVRLQSPLPVGTLVDVRIGIEGGEVKAKGIVRTVDPALGNGIEFTEIDGTSRDQLQHYLITLPSANSEQFKVIR